MNAKIEVNNSLYNWLRATFVVVILLFSVAACAQKGTQQVGQATPSSLPPTSAPLVTPTTLPSPTAVNPAAFTFVFGESCPPDPTGTASRCPVLINGELKELDLPARIAQIYDYAPTTGRILFGSVENGQPAGHATYRGNDLQMIDVATGNVETLVKGLVVVRALWAPNGQDLVYHRATETTYELVWRSASGEERVLAADLPPVFGMAPSGKEVAFTRDSKPPLGGAPGIYVVSLDDGKERQLSNLDPEGGDRPVWSLDSQYFLLGVKGDLYLFKADGSVSTPVYYDPSLANQPWFRLPPDVTVDKFSPPYYGPMLWHPDGHHFIGSAWLTEATDPKEVMFYDLDHSSGRIVSGTVLAEEGILLGWDKVGQSVWIQVPSADRPEVKSVPLPQ
jgi:hypothetical protein